VPTPSRGVLGVALLIKYWIKPVRLDSEQLLVMHPKRVCSKINGVEVSDFEYIRNDYVLKDEVRFEGMGYDEIEEVEKNVYSILPGIQYPFSMHNNTLNNIHNSIMSRNFRSLLTQREMKSATYKKRLQSLEKSGKKFLKGLAKIDDSDVLEMEPYLSTRTNWSALKKNNIREASLIPKQGVYSTKVFVKSELVFKSTAKAPRTINDPAIEIKAKYGRYVSSYTRRLKKNFRYGSSYNNKSKHVNFIWTSGMNRNEIGRELDQVLQFFTSTGMAYEILCADYSKFEATQSQAIMKNLRHIYKNTTSGFMRDMLLEHTQFIIGKKIAYGRTRDSDFQLKYKFKATRTSGDLTTTVGNTVLAMLLFDWIYVGNRPNEIFLFQAGDDVFVVGYKGFRADLRLDWIQDIGMKLDVILAEGLHDCDFNSSFFTPVEIEGERTYILAGKIGRMLAKCAISKIDVEKVLPSQLGSLIFQKSMCMARESQLFPGISRFYKRIANLYSQYKTCKMFCKYKDLITKGNIVVIEETIDIVCDRYGISHAEYDLINETFDSFEPHIETLHDQAHYDMIIPILKKIMITDVCEYDEDDIDRFHSIFTEQFMSNYLYMMK
jgi:hypothetical protein